MATGSRLKKIPSSPCWTWLIVTPSASGLGCPTCRCCHVRPTRPCRLGLGSYYGGSNFPSLVMPWDIRVTWPSPLRSLKQWTWSLNVHFMYHDLTRLPKRRESLANKWGLVIAAATVERTATTPPTPATPRRRLISARASLDAASPRTKSRPGQTTNPPASPSPAMCGPRG
jgi:hypothetical protein